MLSYEWDEGGALSARGDESTGLISERRNHTLLRPIYMNAVEVGYAYAQQAINIGRCHRGWGAAIITVALLPYCFKIYPDKSTSWPELMALFKMNLIEFTPGYGSEKYTEVNRILANRAADTGGCIVARSQMHDIVEERPTLDGTVEKRFYLTTVTFRLLMPSFNHNDIIFPVDGPLGRCGPSLQSTLECPLADPDWRRCSVQQMVLRDQRYWLTNLCALVPDQVAWRTLLHAVMSFRPSIPLPAMELQTRCSTHAHENVCRPETNPIDAKEYRCSSGFSRAFEHEQPLELYRPHLPELMSSKCTKSREDFLPEYLRSPENFFVVEQPSDVAEKFLLDQVNSSYPAEYIGYSTTSDAIRVVGMHPRVRVVGRLVDFALVEPDETDDDKPGEDILNYAEFADLLKAAKVNWLLKFGSKQEQIRVSTSHNKNTKTAVDIGQ
uniref:RNase_Zc3h12a domain-containing protein n=1 Tax=Angiostrongylus cantonensis TaxID=6313 RepID=A0A0K0CT33_ANGCA